MLRCLRTPLLAFLLPLLATGCDPIDEQADAARTLQTMLEVTGPASAGVIPLPEVWRSSAPAGALVLDDSEMPCRDGGKFRASGWLAPDPELDHLYGVHEHDMTLDFRRCDIDGVVMRGSLDYTFTIEAGPSNAEPRLTWTYAGELRLRGELRGTCEVDLVATADTVDGFGHVDARELSGTICGFEVDELLDLVDLESAS